MRMAGPGTDSAERTDVDDAAVSCAEMRKGLARDEERAAGVGFEYGIPLIESEAFERGGGEDGSVVNENVDAAEYLNDVCDCGLDRGFGADVTLYRDGAAAEGCDFGGCLRSFGLRGSIGDRDVGTGASKGERDGAPDAFGASGDEDGFAGERFSGHDSNSLSG